MTRKRYCHNINFPGKYSRAYTRADHIIRQLLLKYLWNMIMYLTTHPAAEISLSTQNISIESIITFNYRRQTQKRPMIIFFILYNQKKNIDRIYLCLFQFTYKICVRMCCTILNI